MIDETHTFDHNAPVEEVTIQRLGNEIEFQVKNSDVTLVFDEDDVVGVYRWLGRNLGPLGEDWTSIVDSENKWPESMSREELYELAEAQQRIIQELQQPQDSSRSAPTDTLNGHGEHGTKQQAIEILEREETE